MPLFDGVPRETTDTRDDENNLPSIVDALPQTQANLSRGVVWADILADIAADEEVRRLRRTAEEDLHQLRDAA
ncbi:hypothetical protein [Actinophytocola sp.]|uniref:hypothetical protein n=1 Tax=Actinophytocola sp. TaxID=1872138 RepID=UPI003D6B71DC